MSRSRIIEFTPPYDPASVRPDYLAGVWNYALGRPACEHRHYKKALRVAEKHNWNPWWVRTYADVAATLDGCYIEERKGRRVCNFFERRLRHTKGGINHEPPRRPVVLIDVMKWDILFPMFAWRQNDGLRRFRRAYIWVPKKFGKSFIGSGLGLYFTTSDLVFNPEVYCAAKSREQAGLVHKEAKRMVRVSPDLKNILTIMDSVHEIRYADEEDGSEGIFKALASDAGTVEGLNWSALIFDELHVQDNSDFFNTLIDGGIARLEPFFIAISTAGIYNPMSIGWNEFDFSRKIYDGSIINNAIFTYIAQAHTKDEKDKMPWVNVLDIPRNKDDDFRDPRVHKKANPGIDITIRASELLNSSQIAAKHNVALNDFKRRRLNMWVRQAVRWLKLGAWSRCATKGNLREELKGRPCYGGLDLSDVDDLTAFGLWFPPMSEGERHKVLVYSFLPREDILELEQKNHAFYQQWADDGWLELTDSRSVDFDYVEYRINELKEIYDIRQVGFDPWQARNIVTNLSLTHGESFVAEVRPGMQTMGPVTAWALTLIVDKRLEHEDNPVLNWAEGNAQAIYDKNRNQMLFKGDKKTKNKIDPLVAILIAGTRAMVLPIRMSVYDNPDYEMVVL